MGTFLQTEGVGCCSRYVGGQNEQRRFPRLQEVGHRHIAHTGRERHLSDHQLYSEGVSGERRRAGSLEGNLTGLSTVGGRN